MFIDLGVDLFGPPLFTSVNTAANIVSICRKNVSYHGFPAIGLLFVLGHGRHDDFLSFPLVKSHVQDH